MTLAFRRLRERYAVALLRLLAGREGLEDAACEMHCFSRVWFVLYASLVPITIVVVGGWHFDAAALAAAGAFGAGALFLAWCVLGGIDRMIYRANLRIAEERRPAWNRGPHG